MQYALEKTVNGFNPETNKYLADLFNQLIKGEQSNENYRTLINMIPNNSNKQPIPRKITLNKSTYKSLSVFDAK